MNPPVEALLFDFGGTLDADGVAWKERFHSYYRDEGLNMPAAAFQKRFFAADDPLVGKLPATTELPATVRALVANLEMQIERGCAAAHNSTIGNARGARVASRFLSEASSAFARNRPVLEALRQRYRLGVVSNFYGNLEAVCRGAELASLFTVVVDSHCVGAEKPDPAIFHVALETLRCEPRNAILVGDSLHRDGEGARRTGMRFIWMAPHYVERAESDHPIDMVIERITELGSLLRMLQ
jgi:putative hydrolase of the HAD superfamily